MRYLATSFGSAGDFLPTLAVASALRLRGHEVRFVSNPFHAESAREAGLEFIPAGERVDVYRSIVDNPRYLSTTQGGAALCEDIAKPYIVSSFRVMREEIRKERPDAIIGSNLSFGAFWAAAERRVPGVMVSATALSWAGRHAPVQFLDVAIPTWLLPSLVGLTRAALATIADQWLGSIACTVGATNIDPSLTATERNVALHLGMWPELVRSPHPRDAANTHACGFARAGHLGTSSPDLSEEIERFLAAGPPPVVVGLGSIFSLLADDLIADIARACADLGLRCLIVGRAPPPEVLPTGTLVARYATYHLLFPRALANVIHGGAGTTGEALRSGRPTVVLPIGYDQFASAWQVEQLGAGVRVPRSNRSRASLSRAIDRAVSVASVATRATEVAAQLEGAPDGAERAAELILRLRST